MGPTTLRANHLFKMALTLYILRQRNRVDDIPKRLFRDRNKQLDYLSDESIVKTTDRESIYIICQDMEQDLLRFTNRSHSIPVSLQVMIALRYYASGSYMSVIGDAHGISKMSVSRCVNLRTTCQIMCSFLCQQKSSKEWNPTFMTLRNFPGYRGCWRDIDSNKNSISWRVPFLCFCFFVFCFCQNGTFNNCFLLKRRYMYIYNVWCLVIQDLSSTFIYFIYMFILHQTTTNLHAYTCIRYGNCVVFFISI